MDHKFCPYCMAPVEDGKPCGACGLTQGSYTPSPHHLPPGTVLKDRYLVGRVLGEGGFGITYIGCDLQLELKTAIKEYFPTDKASRVSEVSLDVTSYAGAAGINYKKGLEKFLQEARTIARMDKQPVIVNVRDFFEANRTAYIVMEYVEGTTFKELVEQRGGRIPAPELLRLIEPLFFALREMHGNGLIHRDISPENLMIEKGAVRLLDFGCAREATDGGNTLTIALKHSYAPVEQYQSKGQGPWTDVYALSATLYYCLTGRKPPQAMDRLVEDELIPPRKLGVDLTRRQEEALLHGMCVPPKRRFQSIEEFHTALYEGFIPNTAKESIPGPGPEAAITGNDPNPGIPDGAGQTAAAAQTAGGITRKPFSLAAWLRQNKLPAVGLAAALAVVILAAVLPRPLEPSSVKDPAPSQTAEPTTVPDRGVPTIGEPVADSDVDCLALFMETAEWLRLDHAEADEAELRSRLDALPIDKLFAGAVSVTTLEELDAALDQDQPIVINADLSIPSGQGRGSHVPVLINEGVTLTLAWDSWSYENAFEGGSDWAVDGSILVNRGTVRGGVINMGDWNNDGTADTSVLLNYGTLYSDLGAGYDKNNNNVAVNLGSMGIAAAQYRQTSFYNLGTLLHGALAPDGETVMTRTPQGGDYFMDFIGDFFYNAGEIVMEGQGNEKRSRLDVAYGSRFVNRGAIRLGKYGLLNNHATLLNYGEITATDSTGEIDNLGWLLNTGPDCALGAGRRTKNVGLVQAGPETPVNLSAVPDGGGGAVLRFGWYTGWDKPADVRLVSDEREFYAALKDQSCALIGLKNNISLTLTEDLILTKGLATPYGSSLTMEGASLAVAGENGYLYADGPIDLRGGVLTVRDEAVAAVRDLRDCGGITIKNQGYLVLRNGLRPNDGAEIQLSDARYLCSIGLLELHGTQVSVDSGVLRGTGGVELYGCTVDVGEQGEFLTDGCGLYFDPDTVITNSYGKLFFNGWDTQEISCRLTNYGHLSTNEKAVIRGTLVNHGLFDIWTGEESRIRVSGSLENYGTVELLGGGKFQPWAAGTVTGVPEQYVEN